ncbi:hypothetical protein [Ensifer sp.]|uniref:hypothetical protein n=1 Tax=Ensifer sp. TaxID=1872086 RepID=UPI0028A00C8A|nr:hypothetical protein [Ensifer sp.]
MKVQTTSSDADARFIHYHLRVSLDEALALDKIIADRRYATGKYISRSELVREYVQTGLSKEAGRGEQQ